MRRLRVRGEIDFVPDPAILFTPSTWNEDDCEKRRGDHGGQNLFHGRFVALGSASTPFDAAIGAFDRRIGSSDEAAFIAFLMRDLGELSVQRFDDARVGAQHGHAVRRSPDGGTSRNALSTSAAGKASSASGNTFARHDERRHDLCGFLQGLLRYRARVCEKGFVVLRLPNFLHRLGLRPPGARFAGLQTFAAGIGAELVEFVLGQRLLHRPSARRAGRHRLRCGTRCRNGILAGPSIHQLVFASCFAGDHDFTPCWPRSLATMTIRICASSTEIP